MAAARHAPARRSRPGTTTDRLTTAAHAALALELVLVGRRVDGVAVDGGHEELVLAVRNPHDPHRRGAGLELRLVDLADEGRVCHVRREPVCGPLAEDLVLRLLRDRRLGNDW